MQVAKLPSDKLKLKFKVSAPAKEVQQKYDFHLQKAGSRARIAGFRPGKTPMAILTQRFGEQALENAGDEILRTAMDEIYNEHKFRSAIEPSIEMISFEKGKDFECIINFEILPNIEIKNFKEIVLDTLAVTISDEDVEQRLKKMCAEHVRYQALEKKRPAQKGDLISVKWSGTLDDGEGIKLPETYQILLGPEKDDSPFYAVVKALYGKNAGDKFEEKIKFSKDEKVPELAGRKATVKVEVQKIEESVTFKLDNTFAKEFQAETLDDLRKSVRGSVEQEGKKVAHLYTKRNLLDALDAQYDFDLPPTMVENEFKMIWAQLQRELAEARASGELDEEDEKKTESELEKDYQKIAKRRVRLGLLISHLADIHKLRLSDEEVRMAIFQEAMRYPSQMDDVIKYYVNNNQALRNLVAPLLEDKVVEFIISKSSVTNRTVDFPTLKKVVRGVIPTPYDDEDEGTPQKTSKESPKTAKPTASKEKKSTADQPTAKKATVEKAKTVKSKGK